LLSQGCRATTRWLVVYDAGVERSGEASHEEITRSDKPHIEGYAVGENASNKKISQQDFASSDLLSFARSATSCSTS
jgi:hypothetical protein